VRRSYHDVQSRRQRGPPAPAETLHRTNELTFAPGPTGLVDHRYRLSVAAITDQAPLRPRGGAVAIRRLVVSFVVLDRRRRRSHRPDCGLARRHPRPSRPATYMEIKRRGAGAAGAILCSSSHWSGRLPPRWAALRVAPSTSRERHAHRDHAERSATRAGRAARSTGPQAAAGWRTLGDLPASRVVRGVGRLRRPRIVDGMGGVNVRPRTTRTPVRCCPATSGERRPGAGVLRHRHISRRRHPALGQPGPSDPVGPRAAAKPAAVTASSRPQR
jgi:hypothetical protein